VLSSFIGGDPISFEHRAAPVFMAANAKSMISPHLAKEATLDSEQQRYERAQARVKELKGFYTHATVYVLVNIGLFVINLLTGGGWWFYWPLLGWGIGLGVHALSVFAFGGGGPWGQDWEERKTRDLMERDQER
jgi:hypothetical protein